MSFAAIKLAARKAVHAAFSVSAAYSDDLVLQPIPLAVRWHMKQGLVGSLDDGGYAEMIEGIERIVFDMQELFDKNVELRRDGIIEITAPEYRLPDGSTFKFSLDVEEIDTGPVAKGWRVTRI